MLAYGPSLSGWFLYEDGILPTRTAIVRGLVRWSHELTIWAAGDGPFPARVVNLGWHLLNGGLLWLLARTALTSAGALFAAGLFLLHPIQTESVAYIASRPELIAGMWTLLACLAASHGRLWLAGLCVVLTLTGKEMGVMAWLLVSLWAWWTRQTWTRLEISGWGVAAVGALGAFAAMVVYHGLWAAMPWSFYGGQLVSAGRLLWLLLEALWHPAALTIDHDWSWMTKPMAATALIGTPILIALAVRCSRTWTFALAWVLIALAPRLLVPMPDGMHERHLYIPLIALTLACGAAIFPKET